MRRRSRSTASAASSSMNKQQLIHLFSPVSSDVRFLTLRDPAGAKFQTIEKIYKHVKKIANTYFIVREKNKQNDFYHYHAIMKVTKEPSKSWFRKGIHMHLCKIGKSDQKGALPPPPINITVKDVREADGELDEQYEEQLVDKVIEKAGKSMRRLTHAGRVVNYMFKDLETPAQYRNYMLVVQGKNKPIN